MVFCLHQTIQAQDKKDNTPRILFILDASYSMNSQWGTETVWTIAKRTLLEFATTLDKKHHAALALRVYGHQYDVSFNNCTDSKLEVPLEQNNSDQIGRVLATLNYKGTTPIAYSMSFAAEDFKSTKGRNSIILITDGEESCGGDPCKIARALQENNICLKPVVIGLNITDFGLQNLKCIGEVSNSKSEKELKENLDKALDKVLDKTTFQINLLDSKKAATETNVPITIQATGGKTTKQIYHTLAANGKPDTLYLQDILPLDIKVHTIPPITKSVMLERFEHNVLEIPAAQGFLDCKFSEKTNASFSLMIRKNKKTIHVTTTAKKTKLLAGSYDIDILSIPRLQFKNTQVGGEQTNTLPIPAPGSLSVQKTKAFTGGLFMVENKKLKKIYSIQPNTLPENIDILPGKYVLIYNAATSNTSYDTKEKEIEITSGVKLNVKL